MDVSNGAGCDRGIRFDACSDFDVGGEEIFFSCCLFSAMAPERVLPSPPSDGGLLRGEEVIRDEILGVFVKGGKMWYYHCPGRRGWRAWLSWRSRARPRFARRLLPWRMRLGSLEPHPRRSLLSQVAEVWCGASASRGAGLGATCVVSGGARVRSRGAHPRRSWMAGEDARLPQAVRRTFVDAAVLLAAEDLSITVKLGGV